MTHTNTPTSPHDALLRKKAEALTDRPCQQCGKPFTPSRPWHKFCDGLCRWLYWNRHHPRRGLAGAGRTRGARAHRGTEFQLEPRHLDALDAFKRRSDLPDRSSALRRLINETLSPELEAELENAQN